MRIPPRERVAPPAKHIVSGGRQAFGTFLEVPARANLADAHAVGPRALRALRLKRWQAMQFGDAARFGNVALFSAGPMALVQAKCFDRRTGLLSVFERKIPFWKFHYSDSLRGGRVQYESGDLLVRFTNRSSEGVLRCEFRTPAGPHAPPLAGDVTLRALEGAPLCSSLPFDAVRGMCALKGLFPAEGTVEVAGEARALEEGFGFLDHHQGYYPYRMRWDWLTAAERRDGGPWVGLNLTANQVRDPERFNENAVWVGRELELLPAVHFERSGQGKAERWRVRDAEGRVDVRFAPVAESRVDLQLLLVASRYRGPFGVAEGHVDTDRFGRITLHQAFGMAEDFYLRA